MQTLWRYVGRRFLSAFLGSLLILALVVLVVDMLVNIDEVLAVTGTLGGAVGHLLVRNAALYLPYLIPVATFTGTFVAVGQAARSNELLAIKAGGVSPLRALTPVLLVAAAIAGLALLMSETVTIRAARSLAAMSGQSDVAIRAGTIWYHTGRFVYNVGDAEGDGDGSMVRDVRVYERDDAGRLVRTIRARRAQRLEPQRWYFEDATIRRFQPGQPDATPDRKRLHDVELMLAEDRSPRLQDRELAGMPVWDLMAYTSQISERGGHTGRAGEMVHERLTIPFLVVLFAVLGLPLGMRVEQTRSLALPALEGVVVLFVFVSLREYGSNLVPAGISPALAPWGVVGLFYSYGVWQLSRVHQ